ncbi:transcriptional regulator PpsR [soil metagenome]
MSLSTGLPTDTSREEPDLGALSRWAPELAQTFVSLASDIALVIDGSGVIRNVAQGRGEPLAPSASQWVGRPWIDTVSGDTRGKIELLLNEVATSGIARKREVNHLLSGGASVPVSYTAVRLGENGPVLAVGRDLRAIAAIQQRFLESQQDLEKGYWRARQAESRYRLLFQVATDAVMVVDAGNWQILEANQAASQLFDMPGEQLLGRPASFGFERHSRSAVDALLTSARASGQSGEIAARLLGRVTPASVAATPFRADDAMRLLVRVRAVDSPQSTSDLNAALARLVDGTSDGVVVTDSSGRILVANPAFLALVHLGGEADVKGRALADWLGEDDPALAAMLTQVRHHGLARRREASVRPAHAPVCRIEISAALLTEGDQECIGFTMRRMAAQAPLAAAGLSEELRAGIEQLAGQFGDAALPQLLRDATALAERYFLQLAADRAAGDDAAAAELLGVSRDGLARRRRKHAPSPASSAADPDSSTISSPKS